MLLSMVELDYVTAAVCLIKMTTARKHETVTQYLCSVTLED